MIIDLNKKIVVSKHAKERYYERTSYGNWKGRNYKKHISQPISVQVKKVLSNPFSHIYTYVDKKNLIRVFDKGYSEYVLKEKGNSIVVITVIFHGSIRGKELIKNIKESEANE